MARKTRRNWLIAVSILGAGLVLTGVGLTVREALTPRGERSAALRALEQPVPGAANDVSSQGPELTDEFDFLDFDGQPEKKGNSGTAPQTQATAPEPPAAPPVNVSPAVRQALESLNHVRKLAGLAPVALDAGLTEGCVKHAHYLVLNARHPSAQGMGAHDEKSGLPGYSAEGQAAAQTSDIAWRSSPAAGVEACLATLYHRIPMLRPNLRRIGIGFEGGVMVMNVISGAVGQEDAPVAYPAANAQDVPTTFPDELPDPVPAGAPHPAGFPITLQFPAFGPEVASVQAELRDGAGHAVPAHLSNPEKPASEFPQQNTICLIPVRPLSPGSTYLVRIAAQVDGSPLERAWSFRTAGKALAAPTVVANATQGRPVVAPRPSPG